MPLLSAAHSWENIFPGFPYPYLYGREKASIFWISAALLSEVKEKSGAIGLPESLTWHEREKKKKKAQD